MMRLTRSSGGPSSASSALCSSPILLSNENYSNAIDIRQLKQIVFLNVFLSC